MMMKMMTTILILLISPPWSLCVCTAWAEAAGGLLATFPRSPPSFMPQFCRELMAVYANGSRSRSRVPARPHGWENAAPWERYLLAWSCCFSPGRTATGLGCKSAAAATAPALWALQPPSRAQPCRAALFTLRRLHFFDTYK